MPADGRDEDDEAFPWYNRLSVAFAIGAEQARIRIDAM